MFLKSECLGLLFYISAHLYINNKVRVYGFESRDLGHGLVAGSCDKVLNYYYHLYKFRGIY
jgi:hypothetical protein